MTMIAEGEMITVEKRAQIRQAYFNENKSIRQIARELQCARKTVRQAIASAEARPYRLKESRAAPVLGPYKTRMDQLLTENKQLPRKQRYTAHKIYLAIQQEGYSGSESSGAMWPSGGSNINDRRYTCPWSSILAPMRRWTGAKG